MATYYQYTPGQLNADELAKLHALPDDALLTAQEAAEVLRIKYTTLAWYRCNGGGPAFVRVGPKVSVGVEPWSPDFDDAARLLGYHYSRAWDAYVSREDLPLAERHPLAHTH